MLESTNKLSCFINYLVSYNSNFNTRVSNLLKYEYINKALICLNLPITISIQYNTNKSTKNLAIKCCSDRTKYENSWIDFILTSNILFLKIEIAFQILARIETD